MGWESIQLAMGLVSLCQAGKDFGRGRVGRIKRGRVLISQSV